MTPTQAWLIMRGGALADSYGPRGSMVVRSSKTVAFFRSQVQQVHLLLDEQLTTVSTRAQASHEPDGTWLWSYVHCACIEDIAVNILIQARAPIFQESWTDGHLRPRDVTSARAYAEAVQAATDTFVARLGPADLERAIDLSAMGLGWPTVGWVLNRFVLWQTAMTCGELAAEQRRAGSPASIGRVVPLIAARAPLAGRADGQHWAPSDARDDGAHSGAATALLAPQHRRQGERLARQPGT